MSLNGDLITQNHAPIKTKSIPVGCHLATLPISKHITIGLAKIFNLEILTHGTSFQNYYGILKNGANPSLGSENGSTLFFDAPNGDITKNAKNHFYVFKDSEAKKELYSKFTRNKGMPDETIYYHDKSRLEHSQQKVANLSLKDRVLLYFQPRMHASMAGMAPTVNVTNKTAHRVLLGVSNFLFSPTIRFLYSLEQTNAIFEDDPDYMGLAYRTSQKLPNSHIGLIGVFKQAHFKDIKAGVTERPCRVLAGIAHLVAGTVFTLSGLGFVL